MSLFFYFEGELYDEYSLFLDILNKSKAEIIIIDNEILYACGSSFKDFGKKCFAINEFDDKEYL